MATFTLPGTKRPLDTPKGTDIEPLGLWLGKDRSTPLEVAVYRARSNPGEGLARKAWKHRLGGRATPLVVVIEHVDGEGQTVCSLTGPTGEEPPLIHAAPLARAQRICEAALAQPDRHAAIRFLQATLPDLHSPVPGIRNEGFLATHELHTGVRTRRDWIDATRRGSPALGKRGRDLVNALDFHVEQADRVWFLKAGARKSAVALFLDRNEVPEQALERFEHKSPISYALTRADAENVPYVILTTPQTIRIYPTRLGAGVGQRGRTETYVEAQLDVLTPDDAGFLWLLFSADAVRDGGSLAAILDASTTYRADLGARLRNRVYEDVVPDIARALARARAIEKPTAAQLEETFQMALLLLFRLLFVAYAEDKDLLPYKKNQQYKEHSLKHKALDLLHNHEKGIAYTDSTRLWEEVWHLFRAVDGGEKAWGVPQYNGGLFTSDPREMPTGALISKVKLPDTAFAPALFKLLIDEDDDGLLGPVDFRSLGVREFGTIYEGLLESELGLAETDLAVDPRTGAYRPPKRAEEIAVAAGEYYLASTSGTRKATGSYFTKEFAVEHLLQNALEAALDEHLARLDALDENAASDSFFDFRVADISMGSGHFLVAAVDHIEARLTAYLDKRPLAGVIEELERLRKSAHDMLGDLADGVEIEDSLLLRRQIARRCIYGVDLKEGAVELARVSLWIHTFVPGLPLSLLDQHLVRGNSLVGIATAEEAERLIMARPTEGKGKVKLGGVRPASEKTLFAESAKDVMRQVAESMVKVARLGDATMAEINQAKKEWEEATEAARPWMVLMDVLAASRLDANLRGQVPQVFEDWRTAPKSIIGSKVHKRAMELLGTLEPCHFPVKFPEVFWRKERPGFDVIVGNPPWEEATVEEDKFWMRIQPGLKGLQQAQAEAVKDQLRRDRPDLVARFHEEQAAASTVRALLTGGEYPGMGTGDPDLYKAFSWRFWNLLAPKGLMGVVLPRSAMAAKGSAEWRTQVLKAGTIRDLTFLLNKGEWVFDGVEGRYTVVLASLQKTNPEPITPVPLKGPFSSLQSYRASKDKPAVGFPLAAVLSWTDTASLPLLPSEESPEVFAQLRTAPRFDRPGGDWQAVPYAEFHATQDKKVDSGRWEAMAYREFDATNDKKDKGGVIEFPDKPPKGYWPVFKGESFDIWVPDTGRYYGWADAKAGVERVKEKRLTSARRTASPFSDVPLEVLEDPSTLPCQGPRIAFRDVTRATDTRTVRAALVPGKVFLTNTAPYFVWKRGDEKDQAFLLGVLCSLALDWYARRFVEIHLNYHVLNPFPIPRPARDDPLWKRTVQLAGRLACLDDRFKAWAKAVGVECGPLNAAATEDMIHELDAMVAHLYGLKEEHLKHIFETFHEGWDHRERLVKTLTHYRKWGGKK